MKSLVLLTLPFILALNVCGQEEKKDHPITKQLQTCLNAEKNQTTAGMIACTNQAQLQWDKELNTNYSVLISKLSADEKEKLKVAQRNWIAYRDKEIEFARTMYVNMQGTMWRVVLADRQMELTKQRALELKAYLDNLTEPGE
jgi:uncharacterized protein YecT (DUF1311 family)